MEEKPKIIVVGGGKLPLWKILAAAVFYTKLTYEIFKYVKMLFFHIDTIFFLNILVIIIYNIGFYLPPALALSVIITKYIDVSNDKLTKEYRVGFFHKKTYKKIPELEYVSVFERNKYSGFEVNLWYLHKGHRRFNIGVFDKRNEALEYGKSAAQVLKIDLLDATEKGNSKWIDLE